MYVEHVRIAISHGSYGEMEKKIIIFMIITNLNLKIIHHVVS